MKNFFILIIILTLAFNIIIESLFAQIKLSESFEGGVFPPAGWSEFNTVSGEAIWNRSSRFQNSGTGCAVSNFSSQFSSSMLVTKRIIPSLGDSLVFYFRQTFWRVYKDTFNVFVSNTDSLASSMITRLLNLRDSINYPVPLGYVRFAINLNAYAGQTIWIGFEHKNLDGDNIRLDDIKIGTAVANDVGVLNNVYPSGIIGNCTNTSIKPEITIKNYGTANQSIPFNIVYSISGLSSYICNRSDTLSSGNSKTIYFDSVILYSPGIYSIKIYTNLASDQNRNNDTLKTNFTITEVNYGGGDVSNGGYYFSNSTSCSNIAPSQPEFCWKDTSGSKNLILNGNDLSGGLLTGDVDNGYFSLGNILPEGRKFKIFNQEYDSIFISTNGILGFTKNEILRSSDIIQINSLMSGPIAMLFPLCMDFDFGNTAGQGNRLSYKIAGEQLIITYNKAPLKSGAEKEHVSFQTCLEIWNFPDQNSNIIIQYDIQSTGDIFKSKYYGNTLPAHLVGVKNKIVNSNLTYRYYDSSGVNKFGPLFNSSLALEFGPDQSNLMNKCSQLNLKVLLEANYPNRDTISVIVRDANPPHNKLEVKKIFLDTNALGSCILTIPDSKSNFYLVINHRNSIETWSREHGEVFYNYEMNYDFSTDSTKAYGNNLRMINGKAYLYSGDVNLDGFIDVSDLERIGNDSYMFKTGYVVTDLNGDGIVDFSDLAFCDNNLINYISVIAPDSAEGYELVKLFRRNNSAD